MRVKVLITGGGTGGHVYPALSIIQFLTAGRGSVENRPVPGEARSQPHDPRCSASDPPSAHAGLESTTDDIAYVGNALGLEPTLVPRLGIPCYFFPMAPPRSVRGLLLLLAATVRSMAVIRRTRPKVTLATGGYVSAPLTIASFLMRVPVVLFLPDIVPGKAVKWLAPLASKVAVSTDASLPYLRTRKAVVTGYPVRSAFREITRQEARHRLDLPADDKVLFVFGGSQGSRNINESLAAVLPDLLDSCYVLHICGQARFLEAELAGAQLTADRAHRYRLFPYLHDLDMAAALVAADLVVCRSGASVLGELPAVGAAAILVPLPAQGVHQAENALFLAERRAAIVLPDEGLRERFGPVVKAVLHDEEELARMRCAARDLDRPHAAAQIAQILEQLPEGTRA